MKICLILEGSYPYVHGGVSSWTHQYISELSEHQFILWLIGAKAEDRGKFVYQLPANVTEGKTYYTWQNEYMKSLIESGTEVTPFDLFRIDETHTTSAKTYKFIGRGLMFSELLFYTL